MTSSALTDGSVATARAPSAWRKAIVERYVPVATMVLALIVIWYVAAVAMNWTLVRDGFEREETPYTASDILAGTMDAERPLLPAPHQVINSFFHGVLG